jgi:hypothetical protein
MAETTVGAIVAGIMAGIIVGIGLSFWCVSHENRYAFG